MDAIQDEDRKRRLRLLEDKIQDPQSKGGIDSLLDTVQALYSDCDHPAIKKLKNVEVYLNRCKYNLLIWKYLKEASYLGRTCNILCSDIRHLRWGVFKSGSPNNFVFFLR